MQPPYGYPGFGQNVVDDDQEMQQLAKMQALQQLQKPQMQVPGGMPPSVQPMSTAPGGGYGMSGGMRAPAAMGAGAMAPSPVQMQTPRAPAMAGQAMPAQSPMGGYMQRAQQQQAARAAGATSFGNVGAPPPQGGMGGMAVRRQERRATGMAQAAGAAMGGVAPAEDPYAGMRRGQRRRAARRG